MKDSYDIHNQDKLLVSISTSLLLVYHKQQHVKQTSILKQGDQWNKPFWQQKLFSLQNNLHFEL